MGRELWHPATEPKPVDPVVRVLLAAGLMSGSSSAIQDLTWDALFVALDYLREEELHLLALGEALYGMWDEDPTEGRPSDGWTVKRLLGYRWGLGRQLKQVARAEAKLQLELTSDTPLDSELAEREHPSGFDTERDLVRLTVAVVLAYEVGRQVPGERLLKTALALGLLAVVDPRFAPLKVALKGTALREAAQELGEEGERLRRLLLQLRYEEERPGSKLLGNLQDAFEALLAFPPAAQPSVDGALALVEGPDGPEAVLGEHRCQLSEQEADFLCSLPAPEEQPVFGVKALCERWGLDPRQDRLASARYSQLARKLQDQLKVACLVRAPRGGKYGLRVTLT